MRPALVRLLLPVVLLFPVSAAQAADPVVTALLDQAKVGYELDADGDYKMVVEWTKEDRSQLVFVSGKIEEVGGLRVIEVFSPALAVGDDPMKEGLARDLLGRSWTSKIGSWEFDGRYVYAVAKVPASVSASDLSRMIDVIAEVADELEIELSDGADGL